MVQQLVVCVIVLGALLYTARKYLPVAWRQRIVHKLSGGAAQGRWATWFGVDASCGSGCDTCGSCETDGAALPETDEKGRKVIKLRVER